MNKTSKSCIISLILGITGIFAYAHKSVIRNSRYKWQAMLSDVHGRTLIIEPEIGYREENSKYSLITNYSLMKPESTRDFIVTGDDRYERALKLLDNCKNNLSISDAFTLLHNVRQRLDDILYFYPQK